MANQERSQGHSPVLPIATLLVRAIVFTLASHFKISSLLITFSSFLLTKRALNSTMYGRSNFYMLSHTTLGSFIMTMQCTSKILKELIQIEEKVYFALQFAQQNNIKINSDEILERLIKIQINS